jgi:predicted acylesterase/phospholipase RssA
MDPASVRGVEGERPISSDAIGLSLSGGGFRATIYHLGVISCLRDNGLLPRLKIVTAVSGGSVLAGHLAKEWKRYNGTPEEFASVAGDLLDFMGLDLRGRVVRRWVLGTLLILPRLFGRFSFHRVMSNTLNRLYKKAKIEVLKGGSDKPSFHILSTSMTTGELCKFTNDRFSVVPDLGTPKDTACSQVLLSVAVAASAAFPPLFPPVPISRETLSADQNKFPHTHYLTDGGIYDNLGLQELWRLTESSNFAALLVSDAGGNFDWSVGKRYKGFVSRNVRATDIIMDRVSKLVPSQIIGKGLPLVHLYIGTELLADECLWNQSPEVQSAVRNTRTDLDAFSDAEILAIARHAYSVTSRQLIDSELVFEAVQPTWNRIAEKERAADLKRLRKTRHRRLRLVNWGDWAFTGILAVIFGWFWILPGPSDEVKDLFMAVFRIQVPITLNLNNIGERKYPGDVLLVSSRDLDTVNNRVHLDENGNAYLTGSVRYNGHFEVVIQPLDTFFDRYNTNNFPTLWIEVKRGKVDTQKVSANKPDLTLDKPQSTDGLHLSISYKAETNGF